MVDFYPGRSPPRTAGLVRPRPTEDTPPASESDSERPDVTKSPHTRRVLKKSCNNAPLVPILLHDRLRDLDDDDDDEATAPIPAITTYASVAAPRIDPQPTPPPGTTRTQPDRPSAPRKALPPTKVSRQRKATPPPQRESRHSPHRLILRWTTSPPAIDQRASVTALAAVLREATFERHCPPHIQGVN
ncbi:hypothetical protein B0H11DRAFT_2247312 [Mycena galericulata]|nr:hypothetical protein B0H11DRAFT_2247312 [Mycena galericulata]